MHIHHDPRRGFGLVEVIVVLALLSILVSIAIPSFRREVDRLRVRSTLDRIVTEVYRVRMLAVDRGNSARLVLRSDDDGCVDRVVTRLTGAADTASGSFRVTLPGLCLRHSGDSILVFDSRGLLRPPARSFHVRYGTASDSVLLSIAGRVRRSY